MDINSLFADNDYRINTQIKEQTMNIAPIQRKQTEDFVSLSDLWHMCVAHWAWFALSLLLCLGLASCYLMLSPNIYTRQAAVLVKQETQGKNISSKGNNANNDFGDLGLVTQNTNVNNVQRQFTSLAVLEEVAQRVMKPTSKQQALRMAEGIRGHLKATIDNEKSTIINLEYSNASPEVAEKVLNSIVQVYNEKWMEDNNQVKLSTSQFIESRLHLLEKDLGVVDDSISTYKMRNKITDLDRVSDVYLQQQSQSDADIMRLTSQCSMAQYILGILKDKSAQHQLLPTNSGINNQVAEAQITQYNTMLLQLKNNLVGTSSQNPLIVKQERELSDVRKNILTTIENHIKTLEIQLKALEGYNGEANSKISSNPGQAKHLASVEREQKVKENLYLYLLQKKEENELSLTYSTVITQMIDMPHGSDEPTSPNKHKILSVAVLVALLIPITVLFVRETMDNTVRDKRDVEHKTALSLIGDIPLCEKERKSWLGRSKAKKRKLLVQPDKQDLVNEAFRYIRTNLEFMTSKSGEKNVYIITSNYEGSGKTFVASNLALALAIAGKHVLLIDGDLRHASASHLFCSLKKGISDYLAEKEDDIDSLLYHPEQYPSLDVLPVGTIPPNPTELLSGSRLSLLLDNIRSRYDFILIDCPPSETLADAGIIERYADRTLFIIRAGLFERKRVEELEADAENGKYKHLSLILNATKAGGRYGYRYGYHYGYHYGYRYGYHRKNKA